MRRPDATDVTSLGEPLVDARTVAGYLGVHIATVYRLAGAPNGLPVVEVARGVRRFRRADVLAFVEARTKSPEMALEARKLLDSIRSTPVDLPRNPGHMERASSLNRGGSSPARPGGA